MVGLTRDRGHETMIEELVVQCCVGQAQGYEVVQGIDVLDTVDARGQRIGPMHDLDPRNWIYIQPAPEIAESTICMVEKIWHVPQFVEARHARRELLADDQPG